MLFRCRLPRRLASVHRLHKCHLPDFCSDPEQNPLAPVLVPWLPARNPCVEPRSLGLTPEND